MAAGLGLLSGLPMTAAAESSRWNSTSSRNAEGDICIDFKDIQVLLPESWSGKARMSASDTAVSFYQGRSRDLWTQELGYANGGWLFSINFSPEYDFLDQPSYQCIGEVADGVYYVTFPTDLQAYTNDEQACSEFMEMSADVDWIAQNITITSDDILFADEEYIFPESSAEYLTEDDLAGLDADDVQMAINEIYARHHRKFVLPEIQAYFDSKSWYDGYVEADDFDVSVMNACEGANISLMVQNLSSRSSADATVASAKDAYGMIIESGSGYFKVRQQDGSVVQLWYDDDSLADMGLQPSDLEAGAIASLIYDAESYEAVSILVW